MSMKRTSCPIARSAGERASSGVPLSSSVGPLRLPKFGRSMADCMSSFQSMSPTSVLATKPMMRLPPGLPTAMSRAPVLPSNTRNGAMELRGRLPGATRLATPMPSSTGWKLKSVSSLFNRNPRTITWLPKKDSMVLVMDTALPSRVDDRDLRRARNLVDGIVVIGELHAVRVARLGSHHGLRGLDQLRARVQIARIDESRDRDIHVMVIGHVPVAIRESEALRLRDHVHRLRRAGRNRCHVEARKLAQDLQDRDAARRRRRHAAEPVGAIGATERIDVAHSIVREIVDAQRARIAVRLHRRRDVVGDLTRVVRIGAMPRRSGATSRRTRDCGGSCRRPWARPSRRRNTRAPRARQPGWSPAR